MTDSFEYGAVYWLPDDKYVVRPAILKGADKNEFHFEQEDGTICVMDGTDPILNSLTRVDPQCMDTSIDDLIHLDSLTENALLHILRGRFSSDMIYTFVSSILIAVNPFKVLSIYNDETMEAYRSSSDRSQLPPHVFTTTDDVYKGMLATSQPHSLIISGESGAGKTETIKFVLKYLTKLSEAAAQGSSVSPAAPPPPPGTKAMSVQDQIMQSNVILEAFGNAKTSRNNNSSRFGKLITLQFSKGVMRGAEIISYLLEKSRVVSQQAGEGTFHVFYQLLTGCYCNPSLANTLQLDLNTEYTYLSDTQEKNTFVNSPVVNDLFDELVKGLAVVGVTEAQQQDIFRVVATVLRLGNITFTEGADESCSIDDMAVLESVCALAGLAVSEVARFFVTRQFGVRSIITCHLTLWQALDARNAFSKALYSFLFDWLVGALNTSLARKDTVPLPGLGLSGGSTKSPFIAVLDIFGFEAFEENSFEQLLINYCNEKLLAHFNTYVFVMEQEEYKREGIQFDACDFKDNAATIALLERTPSGLLALMDEELQIPKGSDEKLLDKIFNKHMKKNFLMRAMARKQKHSHAKFVVTHFAGEVAYDIRGFMEKNKDALPPSFVDIGAASTVPFIADLFQKHDASINGKSSSPGSRTAHPPSKGKGGQSRKETLGGKFKKELTSLVNTLNRTTPRFVRCMKSNMQKVGNVYESPVMLKQLQYSGLLEVCRIRQSGFPVRLQYEQFLKNFWTLDPGACDGQALVYNLQKQGHFDSSQFQMGSTKVFFKSEAIDVLTSIRFTQLFSHARRIQAFFKGYMMRCKWKQILAALKTLADANRTGKEEDLMEACNLVSETVPHQGLHLQVMLDSLTLIEQLQGEDGDNPFSEEERFTDDASRETSMGGSGSISGSISGSGNVEGVTVCENPLLHRGTLPIPPSPRFAPPPPPTTFSSSDSSAPSPQSQPWTGGEGGEGDGGGKDTTPAPPTFNSIDTSLPKPIPEAPLPRKVITRMVSQEIINVSDSLQYHIEKLFNASKCREGLSEEEMAPLNEALQATLACDSVRAEDIGLMHEAADELEHAGLQLEVQERINRAVESEEMNIEVLRCLFCEGNELGMNNYEGMLQIQQVIQRKALKETTTGSGSGDTGSRGGMDSRGASLQTLVELLRQKSASERGVSSQDLAEVEGMLAFLQDKYGECALPEVQIAKQEIVRCRAQIDLQDALGHINHRTPKKVMKELWMQGKEIGMTKFKGFRTIDKLLYPELSPGAPNVIKIIDGLKAQAMSSRGVSKEDIDSLQAVLNRMESVNYSEEDKSFRIATHLLAKVTKQLTLQNALRKVTVMTPLSAKQSLYKQGNNLGMEKFEAMVALKTMLGDYA